jgi:hypothetical protein
MAIRAGDVTNAFGTLEEKLRLLDDLILRKAAAVLGRRAGYAERPDVKAAIERLIADRYLQDAIEASDANAEASDAEIEAYYREHQAEFVQLERARASVIVLRRGLDSLPDDAESMLAAVKVSDTAFADAARTRSRDDSTRLRAGDMGWFVRGASHYRWPAAVIDAVFDLKEVGETKLVTADDAAYLLRLTDRQEESVRPLREVANTIRNRIRVDRVAEAKRRVGEQIRQQVEVTVFKDVVASVGPPVAAFGDTGPPSFPLR